MDWFTNKEIADAYDATPSTRPIAEHRPDVEGTVDYQVLDGYDEIPAPDPDSRSTFEPRYITQHVHFNNAFRRVRPETGIGAFAITAEDGTT